MKNLKVKDFVVIGLLISALIVEFSKNIIAIPLIILWLILAINDDKKIFKEYFLSNKKMVILIYLWMMVSFVLYILQNKFMTSYEIKNIFRIAMNLLIFGYYLYYEDKKKLTIFLNISLIIILMIGINTIINLIKNPNLSRILSTANPEKYYDYVKVRFIGSFGFAYGLVFIIFSIIGSKIFNNGTKNKIIYIISVLILILTVIYEQFTISIILLGIAICLHIFRAYNIKRLLLSALIFSLIFALFLPSLNKILKITAENIKHESISQRIYEISSFMESNNLEQTIDFKSRIEKYTCSIRTFLNDPLGLEKEKEIGGHSELLDEYAKYGLIIASLTTLVFISYMKFINRNILTQKNTRNIWFINEIVYLIYATINTSMFIITSTMIFFIVPLILKTSEGENVNEDTLDS